ncbi:succinyl-diaminopimelate desuccinylase [Schaalia sp. Marseille-Q2122]|uniref:succinyl-diaminopimelate desuccinylase n=1 Tax=Schaalia sp. Marseille-Q2122 TaxID=2736604 RepID=UPI0020CA7D50|nr:succinyl-diaminopimelate desuccinylase [Schaalia sp. Marseille-Q2122]
MLAPSQLTLTDPVQLTAELIDIPSVSGDEARIADAVEASLRACPHLQVTRNGDAVVARTNCGRPTRVIIAGHLDTVPISDNVPSRRGVLDGQEAIIGRGSVDMKAGVAVALHLAHALSAPRHDVTWIFYDHEEVADALNGLGRLSRDAPELLDGDFAILGEPTSAHIEGGCNGTLRVIATFPGVAAHSARAWRGDNAIHKMAPVISAIAAFGNPEIEVDGLVYRESLSVVGVSGGGAANVIPEEARMVVNYRFAPSTSGEEALAFVRSFFDGTGAVIEVDDLSPGARPGMDAPIAREFAAAARASGQVEVNAKEGWTDVARFGALGVPAINYGPGNPLAAHTIDEAVAVAEILRCAEGLGAWLAGETG